MSAGEMAFQGTETSEGGKFIVPQAVIDQLGILPHSIIADFGCGTGYFVFPLARKVQEGGKVYALDILPQKLEVVESEAKLLGLTNVITHRVNLEKLGGSKLEESSVDWVFLVNMLFQNKDKGIILREAKRVMKPDGKMLIIEWDSQISSVGPVQPNRISKEALIDIAIKENLSVAKEIKISDLHYGLIFIK